MKVGADFKGDECTKDQFQLLLEALDLRFPHELFPEHIATRALRRVIRHGVINTPGHAYHNRHLQVSYVALPLQNQETYQITVGKYAIGIPDQGFYYTPEGGMSVSSEGEATPVLKSQYAIMHQVLEATPLGPLLPAAAVSYLG